jgi:CHRD domain
MESSLSKGPSGKGRKAMRRLFLGWVLGLALLVGAAGAQAAIVQGGALLTGDQEVPPTGSSAIGIGSFTLDTDTNTISNLIIQVHGFSTSDLRPEIESQAHIHQAPVGVNGSVVVPLSVIGTFTDFPGGFKLEVPVIAGIAQSVIDAMRAGDTYFNIHTVSFPGGEIRGQIALTPIPAALPLLASALGGLGYLGWRRRRS